MSRSLAKRSNRESVKLEALGKLVKMPKELTRGLAFPKEFKAGVIVDRENAPRYFVFDASSLWDMFCAFDERFEKTASTEEYVHHNPFGWLVDAIESILPLNPKLVVKLKRGIAQAEKLGFVPFRKIMRRFGLSHPRLR